MAEKPKYGLENAMEDAFKLRRVIVQISEKSPSHARSVIDQFLRFIAPSMARTAGADFPVTCRRNSRDAERTTGTNGQGKYPLLSYISTSGMQTLLGFYAALATGDPEALHQRLNLLEGIAILGLDNFVVVGDEVSGYTLMEKTEALNGVSGDEPAKAAGATNP